MQRIKGGTVERAASNCYGNQNFTNKYFSIACFLNKLTCSFHLSTPFLFLHPLFISLHLFLPFFKTKGKYSLLRYFATWINLAAYCLFINWDRKYPYFVSRTECCHMEPLGSMVRQEPRLKSWQSKQHGSTDDFLDSLVFSNILLPCMLKRNAALNYRKYGQHLGHLYSYSTDPVWTQSPFQPKLSLVSCALAKHVYLFLAHILLCWLLPFCLECSLPLSPFLPSIASNSPLFLSQAILHFFHQSLL